MQLVAFQAGEVTNLQYRDRLGILTSQGLRLQESNNLRDAQLRLCHSKRIQTKVQADTA